VYRASGYEPGLARAADSENQSQSAPSKITTTHVAVMSSVTPNDREDAYRIELLQGSSNYRTWKFSMKMVLQAKDLWEVVSGDEAKPVDEKAAQAWEKKARKALAAIALTLSAVTEGLAAMGQRHGRWKSQWEVCSDASLKKVWLLQEQ
jgi:hypothetical protein